MKQAVYMLKAVWGAAGSDVALNVAARDLHLFDTASGKAIAHGGALG